MTVALCKKNNFGYNKVQIASKINTIKSKDELDHLKGDKNILQVSKLNQKAYMELILLIDHKTNKGKATFVVVKNCKMSEYLEGNYKMA